jgi:hypothetical protein
MAKHYKRFMVIGFDNCYPHGGVHDCQDSFDWDTDAKKYIENINNTDEHSYENYEIFDRISGMLIEV